MSYEGNKGFPLISEVIHAREFQQLLAHEEQTDGLNAKEVDHSQSITSDVLMKCTERPWNKQLFLAGSRPSSVRDVKMAPRTD